MKVGIVLVICILFAGCVATTPAYNSPSLSLPQKSVKKEPKWVPLTEGASILFNENYEYHPSEMKLNNGMLLPGSTWADFLKDFVESFPPEKRENILDGLTRFYKEYDKVDKVIKFEPLRYMSEPYSSASYISLKGRITKDKADGLIIVKFYGSSWIFADSIKVVADDYTWQSPKLYFYRDNYTKVWEYAFLDLNSPEVRKMIESVVNSKEAIIRFNGKQYYSDLTVTERMKKDILAIIRSINTINGI